MSQTRSGQVAFCALMLSGAIAVAGALPAGALGLFEINLIPGPGLQANPAALDAFRRAAAEWEAQISNPIRVNVTADLGTFSDPNIIGATGYGSENLNLDYTTVRDRLVARATRMLGDAAAAEDVVQEAFRRLHGTPLNEIDDVGG